ncbi:MAG: threonine/serine dehydratase [Hyphomicrobiaceae bacterium]|nr:threonine/serine dehydratase [Hyphomicrobiaceae bacterium]
MPNRVSTGSAITADAIAAMRQQIAPYLRRTPILALDGTELGLASFPLALKLELMQHSGSFKARGAFASLSSEGVPKAGVAAASGGNHGAAVAYAAGKLGIPARIFVPSIASPAKIDRIRGYGADLVVEGDRYANALALCEHYCAESGARSIHAYDQPATVLGQGTLAVELEEQAPDLDTLLVAVGGGGLIGGIAGWYRGRVRLVAVEPDGAPSLSMALAAGRPVDAPQGSIAADSLAPRQVGQLIYPLAASFVARSVLVTDGAIREAQRLLWDALRIVAEPGGATALAALVSGAYEPSDGERVGVLVCGGNTTAVDLAR